MGILTRHLDEVGETYFQHLGHATGFAVAMVTAGLACFLHALFPFLFEKTGSACISKLHDKMVVNRKNLSRSRTRAGTTVEQAGRSVA